MRIRSPRLVVALAAATLATAGCAPVAAPDVGDRTIVIAVDYLAAASWDPAQGGSTGDLLTDAVMSSLFAWLPSGGARGLLGESYEMADDRRSVVVTLREGIEFSDGSPVDAEAIASYWDHLLSEESTYVFKLTVQGVGAEVTAVDERTVRIAFAEPVFHPEYHIWDVVRLMLVTPVVGPAGVADPAAAKAEPMSVGPYLLEEIVPEIEATFIRNPAYWDPESFPYDTVVLKAFDDSVAKLNALKSGQVDATTISTEQIPEAESSGFRVQYGWPNYVTLQFRDPDGGKSEPLRDVRVRRAIAHAFDREAIAETIDLGYGHVSSQILVEGQPGYVEDGDDRYPYDPEKARGLLAEAGYADGFDLVIPSGASAYEPIVQQSLADIGIRVTFEREVDLFTAFTSPDYPVTLYQEPNINSIRLLDEEFAGYGRYFDPDAGIRALLDRIQFGDEEDSEAASRELGQKLLEEVWYVPIARPPYAWATTQGNEVVTDDLFGGGYSLTDFRPVDE